MAVIDDYVVGIALESITIKGDKFVTFLHPEVLTMTAWDAGFQGHCRSSDGTKIDFTDDHAILLKSTGLTFNGDLMIEGSLVSLNIGKSVVIGEVVYSLYNGFKIVVIGEVLEYTIDQVMKHDVNIIGNVHDKR